jgi:hypothetical protein
VFYLALGYFISYLPYALLAKALSSGIVPGIDRPVGGPALVPAAALGLVATAGLAPPGRGQLIAIALAPDVADRTHRLAEGDLPEPSATSLDDHRRTAVVVQQAVRRRLAEQFL